MGVGLITPGGGGGGGAAPTLIAAFTHQSFGSGADFDLISPDFATPFDLTDCNIRQYVSSNPAYEVSLNNSHPTQTGYAFVAKVPNGHRIVIDCQVQQNIPTGSGDLLSANQGLDLGVEPAYSGAYLGYGLYPAGPSQAGFPLQALFPDPGVSTIARGAIFASAEMRFVHQDFIVPDNDPAGWYAYFNPRPSAVTTVDDGMMLGQVKSLFYTLWDHGVVTELA